MQHFIDDHALQEIEKIKATADLRKDNWREADFSGEEQGRGHHPNTFGPGHAILIGIAIVGLLWASFLIG